MAGAATILLTRVVQGRGLAVNIVLVLVIVAFCGGCRCEGRRCRDEERRALLEIKKSLNYPNGTALPDWGLGGGKDCCRWSNIACNHHTGRVVSIGLLGLRTVEDMWYPNFTLLAQFSELESLDLGWNNIGGTFPDVLCQLKRLNRLDLGDNSLEGPIPHCLCNMSSLTSLDLSQNRLRGSISSCLGNLHDLEMLFLADNEFEGSIPPPIFPNLTKLRVFGIGGDRLEGTLSFSGFANLSNLVEIWISSNYGLEIETESPSWVPSLQLTVLNIRSCVVNKRNGGRLPGFISTQSGLENLALVDVSITGTIPLWVLCNSSLWYLNLAGNKFHGTFHPPCRNASSDTISIDLSHNHVYGSLPTDVGISMPNLAYLNMAGNELTGSIPPSLGQAPLDALDLSDNHLSGKLPMTLTRNQTTLGYLNVSNNQLDGEMLPTDPYMPRLKFLYLHHNRLTGSIPPKISNSSLLMALDVGHNDLACSLSHCLPSFPSMIALSLRKNRFDGPLPSHLCQMQHLHLLDLFGNNLSGKIPPCLNNISSWKPSSHKDMHETKWWLEFNSYISARTEVMHFTSKKSLNPYQGDPLTWMTGLDVSSNRLDGAIPSEIGELRGLHSLNLSNNRLQGSLPMSISNMENLESLDLSHNNLSGTIPHELLRLHFLSTFSVAFNDFSGVIPYNQQFSTFPNTSYEGNPALCGAPLERNCSSITNTGQTHEVDQNEAEESSSILDNTFLFYACVALSFVLGFWGFIATIVFNKMWRIKFFGAVDRYSGNYLRGF